MNISKPFDGQIDAELVRAMFDYDQETGTFIRLKTLNTGDKKRIGAVAGYAGKDGYRYLKIGGIRISEHRAAWLHFYGKFPDHEVDHIDGNPSNNAITNLRDVRHCINMQNLNTVSKSSKSGVLGVTPHANKWRARIRLNSKGIHIGLFDTKEQAYAAFIAKKRELHEGNTL